MSKSITRLLGLSFILSFALFTQCEKPQDPEETPPAEGAPTVTTNFASRVSENSGRAEGNVTANGGSPILERGICYAVVDTPTISNKRTIEGSGTGSFTSDLADLIPGNKYLARAYAINKNTLVGYGETKAFYTFLDGFPVVETTPPNQVGFYTAFSGGKIIDDGGSTVTERGVCWSRSPNPTIQDNRTMDGFGKGTFESSIIDLKHNATYYIRAYAINDNGTSYGFEYVITTSFDPDAEVPCGLEAQVFTFNDRRIEFPNFTDASVQFYTEGTNDPDLGDYSLNVEFPLNNNVDTILLVGQDVSVWFTSTTLGFCGPEPGEKVYLTAIDSTDFSISVCPTEFFSDSVATPFITELKMVVDR